MSSPAQVRSTDAIDAVNVALADFRSRVTAALDALDMELQRAESWIEHDRPRHWRQQIRAADDRLHEAKVALEQCLLTKVVAGERPACREEKAALAGAKAQLKYARQKAEIVKHWQRNFRHESMEFRGRVGQLRRAMDQDVPAARALLATILQRVAEYQLERAPEAFAKTATAENALPPAPSLARPASPEDATDPTEPT